MPVLPSYRETSQLICMANQLTGFYKRATLAPNGLSWNLVSRAFRICKIRRYFFLFLLLLFFLLLFCCCYFFYYYCYFFCYYFYFILFFHFLFYLFYFFIFYFYFFILFFFDIHLTFWCYLINLPAVYSQRLEASGFSY